MLPNQENVHIVMMVVEEHTASRFRAELSHIIVIWVMMPCSLIDGHQCFGGSYCLHIQVRSQLSWESVWMYRSGGEETGQREWLIRARDGEKEIVAQMAQ
jgi:hypothetical protein